MKTLIAVVCLILIPLTEIYTQTNPWSSRNSGLPASRMVRSICLLPGNDLFIGIDGEGIYYSENGGTSWVYKGSGIGSETMADILYDGSSGHLIAGTYDHIYYSTNNGNNWYQAYGTGANCLNISSSGDIFAGLNSGGVAKSTDHGISWFTVNNGFPIADVRYLAFDQEDNQGIYAATPGYGIYKSTNNGNSWYPVNTGIADTTKYFFTIELNADHEIFVGYDDGVYYSGNLGANWTEIYHREGRIVKSFAFTKNGQLFRGDASAWVHLSTDNGVTWDSVSNGLTNGYIMKLVITNTGMIYAGTGDGFSVNNSYLYPTAPTGLTADAVGARKINLMWNRSANNPASYFIYRSNSVNGNFSLIDMVTAPDTVFTNTGLNPSTSYYYTIIASNTWGSSPASGVDSATTLQAFVDPRDGREYSMVTIGTQTWMAENLMATKYRNGDDIPNVTDDGAWNGLTSGAYCDYGNDTNNSNVYGRLYNWHALNDSRGLAPVGWHIASDDDWTTLTNYLGGESIAAAKLKEAGVFHWGPTNNEATNESGFTALPGSFRSISGTFSGIGFIGNFWSNTEYNATYAWTRDMNSSFNDVSRNYDDKRNGLSIRCVKNDFIEPPSLTSFTPASGPVGTTVTINGTNFNSTATYNVVYFGGVKASVTGGNATQLSVTVPAGASYGTITVTDTVTGLTGYSSKPFRVTFSGSLTIDNGSFSAGTNLTSGNTPVFLAVCDIDGDGKADIANVNPTINTVTVFRNISVPGTINAGSFEDSVNFMTGAQPHDVAFGDLNGDGKPDMAVVNQSGNSVSVFMNTSVTGSINAGSFAGKVDFAAGSGPRRIVIGDLDRDGKPDLVITNQDGHSVSVLRNVITGRSITSGSFEAAVNFSTGTSPYGVTLCDVDEDGKTDILVVNHGSHSFSVLRNRTTFGSFTAGSFAEKVDFGTGQYPNSLTAGDVDGDGRIDIAVSNMNSNSISVYRNTGVNDTVTSGSFDSPVNFSPVPSPYGISFGLMNGDDKADIITANANGAGISIYRNISATGSILFSSKVDFSTGSTPYCAVPSDLDGDGKPDLAVTVYGANVLTVFRNLITSVPSAPNNLTATTSSSSQVNLSWTASSSGDPNKYYIYRSLSSGSGFTLVDSVNAPTVSKTHTVPNPSTKYYFHIKALNTFGLSDPSGEAFATTFAVEPTAQPTNLTFPYIASDSIRLSFNAASGSPSGYIVLRRAGNAVEDYPADGTVYSTGADIGTSKVAYQGSGTNFYDTGLSSGTNYHYAVFAYRGNMDSINYLTDSPLINNATTTGINTEPTHQPTNLVFSNIDTNTYKVTFNRASGYPAGYLVLRSETNYPDVSPSDGTTYSPGTQIGNARVASVGSDTSYTESGLSPNTLYYYRIYSFNGTGGQTDYLTTNPLAGTRTTLASQPIAQPTEISFHSISADTFKVEFKNAVPVPTGYIALVKIGSAPTANPSDGTVYSAGNSIGDAGVVYTGSSHEFDQIEAIEDSTYYYKIISYNGSGNAVNYLINAPLTGQYKHINPLKILSGSISLLPANPVEGDSIKITVTINGKSPAAFLTYGNGSHTSSFTVRMNSNSSAFFMTIPHTQVTREGVVYRIKAVNAADSVFYPAAGYASIPIGITDITAIQTIGSYPDGVVTGNYSTISLPLNTSLDLENYIGPSENGTQWRLVSHAPTEWVDNSIMESNKAYFFFHREPENIQFTPTNAVTNGTGLFENYELKPEWNLVPWPYAFTANITSRDNLKIGAIHQMIEGSYDSTVVQFKPFGGYVIYNKTGANLFIRDALTWAHTLFSKPLMEKSGYASLNWNIHFKLRNDRSRDLYNIIGVSDNAMNEFDVCDDPEPISPGEHTHIYFTAVHSDQSLKKLACDIRSSAAEGNIWDIVIERRRNESYADLSWAVSGLPDNYTAKWYDFTTNTVTDLLKSSACKVTGQCVHKGKVIVGTTAFVSREIAEIKKILPDQFALHQNYPNPFNPNTTIRFDVAKTGNVKLHIYNILGQLVTTLVNGNLETGKYDILWNGKDARGNTVSSGIYIYRLVTDGYVKSRKMILVR